MEIINQPDAPMTAPLDFEQRFQKLSDQVKSVTSHNALLSLLHDQILEVFQVDMASIFLIGTTLSHLVNLSIIVMTNVVPLDEGFNGPTKSI